MSTLTREPSTLKATHAQIEGLASIVMQQAEGLRRGVYARPEGVERLLAENVETLYAWTRRNERI